MIEKSSYKLIPMTSSFGNSLGHVKIIMKKAEASKNSSINQFLLKKVQALSHQIELILLKMHTGIVSHNLIEDADNHVSIS